jgi:hypothetical protein
MRCISFYTLEVRFPLIDNLYANKDIIIIIITILVVDLNLNLNTVHIHY